MKGGRDEGMKGQREREEMDGGMEGRGKERRQANG